MSFHHASFIAKFFKTCVLGLAVLAPVLALSGCSDNGPDKKPVPQPVAVQTPVAPAALTNPMQWLILDAQSGELLNVAVDVRVSGADAASFSNHNALISPNKPNQYTTNTGIIQFEAAGTPSATPLNATFSFEFSGYYTQVVSVQLNQDGFTQHVVRLSPRLFANSPAVTTATVSASVSSSTGELGGSEDLLLQTEIDASKPILGDSQFSLTVPVGTIATNASSNTVFIPITLQALFYPVDANNSATMRGTPLAAVHNGEQILSLGLVFLYMIDSNGVRLESFDSDLALSFEVPKTVINPITGTAIALNDTLKFFSRDSASGEWNDPSTGYDATVTAVGATHATVDITVPAGTSFADQNWNLGWSLAQVPALCPAGVQFDVVDANGLAAEQPLLLKTVAANGAWAELFDTALNTWFGANRYQSALDNLPDLPGEIQLYSLEGEALTSQITLADTSVISAVEGKISLNSLCDLQGATVQISSDNTEQNLVDSQVSTNLLCDVAIPVDINGNPVPAVPTPAFNNVIYNGAVLGSVYSDGATPAEFPALPSDVYLQFRADTFESGQSFSVFDFAQAQFSNAVPVSCPEL